MRGIAIQERKRGYSIGGKWTREEDAGFLQQGGGATIKER